MKRKLPKCWHSAWADSDTAHASTVSHIKYNFALVCRVDANALRAHALMHHCTFFVLYGFMISCRARLIHCVNSLCLHVLFFSIRVAGKNEETLLADKSIVLECCLTSNVLCGSVTTYEDHHFKKFYESGHSVVIGVSIVIYLCQNRYIECMSRRVSIYSFCSYLIADGWLWCFRHALIQRIRYRQQYIQSVQRRFDSTVQNGHTAFVRQRRRETQRLRTNWKLPKCIQRCVSATAKRIYKIRIAKRWL